MGQATSIHWDESHPNGKGPWDEINRRWDESSQSSQRLIKACSNLRMMCCGSVVADIVDVVVDVVAGLAIFVAVFGYYLLRVTIFYAQPLNPGLLNLRILEAFNLQTC